MAGFDPFLCATVSNVDLTAALDAACENSIDQTQAIAIEPITTAAFTVSTNASTDIDKSAAWTTKLAATLRLIRNVTKFTITPGDFQETADENNINGIPQYIGNSFSVATGRLVGVSSAYISELEKLTSLTSRNAGVTGIKCYLLGRNNRITAGSDGEGFAMYNFAIKDVTTEGRNKEDVWEFKFLLAEDWSKVKKTFVASDFIPTMLTNPA